ncbi:TPA: HNH endonuclease, partial [Yersinia enterocolitica]|nr:HNH endonuclease [Yersinia enterocolitica]
KLTKSSNLDEIQSVLNSLFRSLSKKLPSYEEFRVNFIELNYISNKTRSKNIIKYALSKQLGDAINCLNIDHDFLTLEHYISESELKKGEKESVVGSIGNLLLIDDKTNSSILNNLDVKGKYKILTKLIYPLEKTFITEADWDEVKVKERTAKIAHVLYNSVSLD